MYKIKTMNLVKRKTIELVFLIFGWGWNKLNSFSWITANPAF